MESPTMGRRRCLLGQVSLFLLGFGAFELQCLVVFLERCEVEDVSSALDIVVCPVPHTGFGVLDLHDVLFP